MWELPKIRFTFFEGPENQDYHMLGYIRGTLILGNDYVETTVEILYSFIPH